MRLWFSLVLFVAPVLGCAPQTSLATARGEAVDTDADGDIDWSVSPEMVAWQRQRDWGTHHLMWHTVRRWDLLDPESLDYAIKHGWSRAQFQEGVAGNGLEFLAMHRVMLQRLLAAFPHETKKMIRAWRSPPTDPLDPENPLPDGQVTPFDPDLIRGIHALHECIHRYEHCRVTDDELGLFVETRLMPTPDDPAHRTSDLRRGIHNYLHNRWADPASPIDLGDPMVNLENILFWRLHGWIDRIWTEFRDAAGEDDATDAVYQAALKNAEMEMDMIEPTATVLPPELAQFFEWDWEDDQPRCSGGGCAD
jgi:hypothetical protein